MRKLLFFMVFHISIALSVAQIDTRISFKIPGDIPTIKQPLENACWITVTTMLLSWKEKRVFTVEEIANRLGDPWKLYYELDTGLQEKDKKNLLSKIGLYALPPANHTLVVYYDLLRKHGPIWITTGDEFGSHARVLIGIEEMQDINDYANTMFVLIDPAEGNIQRIPVLKFMKVFEEIAFAANRENWRNIPIQIFHFY